MKYYKAIKNHVLRSIEWQGEMMVYNGKEKIQNTKLHTYIYHITNKYIILPIL
jgi:hypothetical protein